MIRIEVDDATLGRTVLSTSALADLVSSLFLLARGGVPWPYEQWAVGARAVLRHDPRTAPLRVFGELDAGFPDFLGQPPRPGVNTLAHELARLRSTPAAEVHRQLDHYFGDRVPDALRPYRQDPGTALARLAEAFAAYWEGAMRPVWPTVQALVDREVLRRARAMAQQGAAGLLDDLHPRIQWQRPVLELDKCLDLTLEPGERRLQFVPQVFVANGLTIGEYDPELLTIPFQARGAAALAGLPGREDHDDERLGLLLGRGRSVVLRHLGDPLTTLDLSARMGVAPSTVSEHLSVLVAAGVVRRHRVGRRVYYQVTDSGRSLLALFGRAAVGTRAG